MELDTGKNLTALLERLAQQVGTTTEQIFPWYVQQSYNEGMTNLATFAVAFIGSLAFFLYAFPKTNWDDGNRYLPMTLAAGLMLLSSILIGAPFIPDSVRKMINPNYYAMQKLTTHIGSMVGR
jgi:hypothetical protein